MLWLSSLFARVCTITTYELSHAHVHVYVYTLAILFLCCVFCLPSSFCCCLFARSCTFTTYDLSHTHVNLYVYTVCPLVLVLHVSLALCVVCCLFFARVCTWCNICIISYTCKCIRLYMLLVCFAVTVDDCPTVLARVCTCTTDALSHSQFKLYVCYRFAYPLLFCIMMF